MSLHHLTGIAIAYGGLLFAAFTLLLGAKAWRRSGVSWPLRGRWIVTAMFLALTIRIEDAAGVRFGLWGNRGEARLITLVEWILIDATTTWVLARWLRGTLLLCEDDLRERTETPAPTAPAVTPGVIFDRRRGTDRRRGWGRLPESKT